MKLIYIIFILLLWPISPLTQNIGGKSHEQAGMNKLTIYQEAQVNLKLGNLDKALFCYAQAVKQAKEKRNAGQGVDAELLAEYAY